MSAELLAVLDRGGNLNFDKYSELLRKFDDLRQTFDKVFEQTDCIVVPSAPDVAPAGLANTGSSIFNKIITMLHAPCVNVPVSVAGGGLPLGLQVIARRYRDETALRGASQLGLAMAEFTRFSSSASAPNSPAPPLR
jgi:Asp-tRNA(Asn)/Glu-tRNA(Gln) amidotransferase A subunit family amidase